MATALQILLQARFGILERRRGRQGGDARLEESVDHLLDGLEAAVQKQRAAHRLERIRENGFAAEAAGIELSGAQLQGIPQSDTRGDLGQRLAADQTRTQAAQVPFGGLRKSA